ncbi:MAG: M48 family metalloprotease [Pseudomonadota bacterium]|nr:M48 family metalloprotease [Pseudomonadota bacterium]
MPWPRPAWRPLALVAALTLASAQLSLAQPAGRLSGSSSASLPSLGDSSELSAAAERRIGDRIAASIYRDPDYVDDPVLVDYLQGIWQPLLAAARARGDLAAELDERFAWEVFLIRDRSINAFALPGGYFGVHLGLIGTVSSADEMAAVLAHEISHVTQRHISRLMTQQSRQAPWMIAAMILGALAASKYPDAGSAAIVGGQALAAQGQLNFSRDMEREADRVGFGVMRDAGYASRGVSSMFDKLQQAGRLNDNGSFPYLRSHPLTTERIAEAQARVQLAPAGKSSAQQQAAEGRAQQHHAMMAVRARILAAPGVDVLRTLLADAQRRAGALAALAALPSPGAAVSLASLGDAGALYGGALAAAQLRQFSSARSLLGQLKALLASEAQAAKAVELLAIEIDLLEGKTPLSAASADIGKVASRAELLIQAKALMAANRAQDVSQALRTWVAEHPKDAQAWQLLALAYGQQGQPVRAIRADAESRAAQLEYAGALDRLKAAQTLMRSQPGSADHVEASILDTRTRQIELLLKEQALQDKVDEKL